MSPLSSVMESQVLQAFSTYAIIVILKMMLMSPLTSYFRLTRKVFFSLHHYCNCHKTSTKVEGVTSFKKTQCEKLTHSLLSLQVFANLEDTKFVSSEADKKLVRTDPDVERVRR